MAFVYKNNEQLLAGIKRIMAETKTTQREIAERLGIKPQGLTKIMNKKNFSFEDAEKILAVMGYSLIIDFSKKSRRAIIMEKALNMKLKDVYNLVEWGNVSKVLEYDDENDIEVKNYEYAMYSNDNNLVMICKVRYEGEEPDSLDIVLGSLSADYLTNVCKTLDNKKEIAAYIYQVSGTASDVFLFDRSAKLGYCYNASDIISVAENYDRKEKYTDMTK